MSNDNYEERTKEIRLADGETKNIGFDRLDRIEHIGRRLTRGDSLREIQRNLEDDGFDEVSYRQVQKDANILRNMKSAELRNKLFFEQIGKFNRVKEEAIRELFDVLEDEKKKPVTSKTDPDGNKEETSNSFARIKAVKQAFNIQDKFLKRLGKLGLDIKKTQLMGESNDDFSGKDVTKLDEEIDQLLDSD